MDSREHQRRRAVSGVIALVAGLSVTALTAACSGPERLTMSVYDMSAISLMSAPAAKTRSPPYRTTARTSSRSGTR